MLYLYSLKALDLYFACLDYTLATWLQECFSESAVQRLSLTSFSCLVHNNCGFINSYYMSFSDFIKIWFYGFKKRINFIVIHQ